MVTIRPARRRDRAGIQRVARRTWHAAYDDILGPDAVDAKVDEWYAAAGPLDDETAALNAIYVHPDRWGDGVGTRLFAAVTDRLRDREFERLRIRVLADNERARVFYRRHGATLADRERIELAGVTVPEVTYERDL